MKCRIVTNTVEVSINMIVYILNVLKPDTFDLDSTSTSSFLSNFLDLFLFTIRRFYAQYLEIIVKNSSISCKRMAKSNRNRGISTSFEFWEGYTEAIVKKFMGRSYIFHVRRGEPNYKNSTMGSNKWNIMHHAKLVHIDCNYIQVKEGDHYKRGLLRCRQVYRTN